jgi:hypothetical protein
MSLSTLSDIFDNYIKSFHAFQFPALAKNTPTMNMAGLSMNRIVKQKAFSAFTKAEWHRTPQWSFSCQRTEQFLASCIKMG